jgi:TatD DNase family protein
MQLVDSHCHIPLIDGGEQGTAGVLQRAREAGVMHMLCVSVDLETFGGVAAIAADCDDVSASVGVHPNTGDGVTEPTVKGLVEHAGRDSIVAIGETGLDYYRSRGDLVWQRARFRTHIRAARESARPLIVHCREAATDVLRILREEKAAEAGGVMHCFVDDWETALAAMDLGFYISLSGIVTFKNAVDLQDVARRLPAERILIETDSPWLAPVPRRGKQNEPAYVQHTAAFVAALRGQTAAAFAEITTRNFFDLFKLAA